MALRQRCIRREEQARHRALLASCSPPLIGRLWIWRLSTARCAIITAYSDFRSLWRKPNEKRVHPPPPPLARLITLLLLALLASPSVAQQLTIPASTGTEACTQGVTETRPTALNLSTPTGNGMTVILPPVSLSDIKTYSGNPGLTSTTAYVGVQEGGRGLPDQRTQIPVPSTNQQSLTFSSLKKNTRYTVVLYSISYHNPWSRACFKTRGEFTPAEQNLVLSEGTWQPNLAQHNQTGCYAVASTRQDIRDCYCNGTRNGTHILAGQTAASQAQRAYLNCPDLDS